ncbi:MAG: type II secretory pathway component GspD/PulD (secretin) [Gammaproteobacteria bacterium]
MQRLAIRKLILGEIGSAAVDCARFERTNYWRWKDVKRKPVVGTRIGFRVTTTVNQVTTESVEFLESGIILKVAPTVDRRGRILLHIHAEVSEGSVSDDRIPSKTTTQVSTRMLVPNGKTLFMGGLVRHSSNNSSEGVPGLGDLAVIGRLFSNESKNLSSSEIVVLINQGLLTMSLPVI